jgi:hypothetical protein
MEIELSLKLNKDLANKAISFAAKKQTSVSELIESYLQLITSSEVENELEISSFVKSMSTGTEIPNDLDYKKEYSNYLTQKHK